MLVLSKTPLLTCVVYMNQPAFKLVSVSKKTLEKETTAVKDCHQNISSHRREAETHGSDGSLIHITGHVQLSGIYRGPGAPKDQLFIQLHSAQLDALKVIIMQGE